MAVKTGTKTGQGSLSKEQMETVKRARKPVDTANKFRLGFLFAGVVALLFIYFGNKLWQGGGWYDAAVGHLYQFLLWDIVLMLLATLVKFAFAARYNHIVKGL